MSQGVLCKNCNNRVHPKLWNENMNSVIYNRSNQHICPICGVTMYTTGGRINVYRQFHLARHCCLGYLDVNNDISTVCISLFQFHFIQHWISDN